jgi:predicted ATP-grasp superfamily ATP-dependent carboligase
VTVARTLIVEPGRSRGALAAARGLHAAGGKVGIGSPRRELSAHSRAVTWRHAVPAPDANPDGFLGAVDRAIEETGYEMVFASDDAELLLLSEHRDRIRATIPHPAHDVLCRALDKVELTELGRRAGLAVPRTYAPEDEDLPDIPLVVKARLHTRAGAARGKTLLAAGRDEALAHAAVLAQAGEEPFVQEEVRGSLIALSVVAERGGRIVAAVQQEADRLFPAGTGMSARAFSVPVSADLLERSGRLLAELSWFGLAQLQFVSPPGGRAQLVDLNPRFYGSMGLATGAGVNLAALWASLAAGGPAPSEVLLGRPGVRYQWLEGDLRRALAERRGGLAHDVLDVLRPVRGTVGAIWSPRDPVPGLRHHLRQVRRALSQSAARTRGGNGR